MAGLQSSSSLEPNPSSGFSLLRAGRDQAEDPRSTWVLAAAGLVVAACAAGALDLSPRWYPNNLGSLLLQAARIVLMTAAIAACAVWALWYVVSDSPSSGAAWITRNLTVGWVFLPCFVLLYQARSVWMLLFAALVSVGFALSLRRLLPAPLDVTTAPQRGPADPDSPMPSLNGLPPSDSPLLLALCIAVLLQAAIALTGVSMLKASLPLAIAVFLLTWRWSAYETRAAAWWVGRYPPLRHLSVAIVVTALVLVPYTIGEKLGWGVHPRMPIVSAAAVPRHSSSGYFGIILYPPPKPAQIIAPVLHPEAVAAGALTKPLVIPFEGPYLYFKPMGARPGPKAHVAHGLPTDAGINVRSTDLDPLVMEAHQKISRSIDLAACGEIDIAITNADTKPGEIDLALILSDSSAKGRPRQFLNSLPVSSSLTEPIPKDRAPVKEVLRFTVPAGAHLKRFDDLTLEFLLAPRHARTGAKVSVESFELIPRH